MSSSVQRRQRRRGPASGVLLGFSQDSLTSATRSFSVLHVLCLHLLALSPHSTLSFPGPMAILPLQGRVKKKNNAEKFRSPPQNRGEHNTQPFLGPTAFFRLSSHLYEPPTAQGPNSGPRGVVRRPLSRGVWIPCALRGGSIPALLPHLSISRQKQTWLFLLLNMTISL